MDFFKQEITVREKKNGYLRKIILFLRLTKILICFGIIYFITDHQFPIDLTNVAKDHTNLENDQLQSLYRRLCVLNRCASMRIDQSHKVQTPQVSKNVGKTLDYNKQLSNCTTIIQPFRRKIQTTKILHLVRTGLSNRTSAVGLELVKLEWKFPSPSPSFLLRSRRKALRRNQVPKDSRITTTIKCYQRTRTLMQVLIATKLIPPILTALYVVPEVKE